MEDNLTTESPAETVRVLRRLCPDTDILEGNDAFRLQLDLPGVAAELLDVSLEAGVLGVVGTRFLGGSKDHERRAAVEYRREFKLPDVIDCDRVEARLDDGVLIVTLPKFKASRARRIEVSS